MPKQILFIDDEPYYARDPVESLQKAGYEVVLEDNAESGLTYLRANAGSLGLVILDYMMPTSATGHETETLDGLATGRWLLREAREFLELHHLPVLILTNRNVETVTKEVGEFDSMKVRKLISVRHKTQSSRSYLPTIVEQILLEAARINPMR